jgi:hypothetical protein
VAQVHASSSVSGRGELTVGTQAAAASLQLLSLSTTTRWTLTALSGTHDAALPINVDGQLLEPNAQVRGAQRCPNVASRKGNLYLSAEIAPN